jgi:hypothetical protein
MVDLSPNGFDGLNQFVSRFHHLIHRKQGKLVEGVVPNPIPTLALDPIAMARWKMGMEAHLIHRKLEKVVEGVDPDIIRPRWKMGIKA